MKKTSQSLEETREVAREFLKTLGVENSRHQVSRATVVALQGDLGAGKTAFTQAVGAELGLGGNLQSPTFVIMKVYDLEPTTNPSTPLGVNNKQWTKFFHIDAYRLERDEELLHLGWEEIISEPENLIFIEWPERVEGVIPDYSRKIFFEFIDENTRTIEFES